MVNLNGYTITELLHEGLRFKTYRAVREPGHEPVILKIFEFKPEQIEEAANLYREFQLLKQQHKPGIVEVYDLIKADDHYVLVLEDTAGISLKEYLQQQGQLSIEDFFNISLKLVESIHQLHLHHIIHQNLTAYSIIIEPKTLNIKLTNLTLSKQLPFDYWNSTTKIVDEDRLPYLSPEQLAPTQKPIDYRTDFYSLGAIFFELLTGSPPHLLANAEPTPFGTHIHLSEEQHKSANNIPKMILEIIYKLLSIEPDQRYFSSIGLKIDLENCLVQWNSKQAIRSFALAKHDLNDNLNISQKLYGRQLQIDEIINLFETVAQGNKKLLLIKGYSGIGKTSLVKELVTSVHHHHGYFCQGKYDQIRRITPYSAFNEAFQMLIKRFLAEPKEKQALLKHQISKSLGNNAKILIDLIPNLVELLGEQSNVPDLSPNESKNRFLLTVQNFINVLAQPEHPLVIFLDDLQWADSDSLELMHALLSNAKLNYFLLIGAYRDNEVKSTHPLSYTLKKMEHENLDFYKIDLWPLKSDDVQHLLADSLNIDFECVYELSYLIWQKTHGNPFFINEFLKKLYQDNLLYFNHDNIQWHWDIGLIKDLMVTDNVVDLLVHKISKLPTATQRTLKLAACIGHQFDLQTLTTVCEEDISQVMQNLWPAIQANLISSNHEYCQIVEQLFSETDIDPNQWIYCFNHDRIQQACYQLIEPINRKYIHLKVGRLLIKNYSSEDLSKNIFEVLNQFNQCLELIKDSSEKLRIAEANFEAGKKAKQATAYLVAKDYLKSCLFLLTENAWFQHHDFIFSVYKELSECAYLTGNFLEAEKIFIILQNNSNTIFEKSTVYQLHIAMLNTQDKHTNALDIGVKSLELLGIKIPKKPSRLYIFKNLVKIIFMIKFCNFEKRIFKQCQDEKIKHALKISQQLFSNAFVANQNIFLALILKMLQLSIKHGHTEETPYIFLVFSFVIMHGFNLYHDSLYIFELSQKLNQFSNKDIMNSPKECFIYGSFISHWKNPLETSNDYFERGYLKALEYGDLVYANYNYSVYSVFHFILGKPLTEIIKVNQDAQTFQQNYRISEFNHLTAAIDKFSKYLSGTIPFKKSEIVEFLSKIDKWPSKSETGFVYLCYAKLFYILGNFREAVQYAEKAQSFNQFAIGTITPIEANFYCALALTAHYHNETKINQIYYLKKLKVITKSLKKFAKWNPQNYQAYEILLAAEIAKIKKQFHKAIHKYHQAISILEKSGNHLLLGISYENLYKIYIIQQNQNNAKIYLNSSVEAYTKLGAFLKLKKLKAIQKNIATIPDKKLNLKENPSSFTPENHAENFNIQTILKATPALSCETNLETLMHNTLSILLKCSQSERAIILKKVANEWTTFAEGTLNTHKIKINTKEPIDNRHDLPLELIRECAITQKLLIFKNNEYLDMHKKINQEIDIPFNSSILLLPIFHANEFNHILYLEKKQINSNFTSDQIETLQIIADQAISNLANIGVYFHATHDSSTRMMNRKLFNQMGQHAIEQSKLNEKNNILALLLLRVKFLNQVMEDQPEEFAKRVVDKLAGKLKSCLEPHDIVACLSSDHYAILLENTHEKSLILDTIYKLTTNLNSSLIIDNIEIPLKTSVGIATFPLDGKTMMELFKKAQTALFRTKRLGHSSFEFYNSDFLNLIDHKNTSHGFIDRAD